MRLGSSWCLGLTVATLVVLLAGCGEDSGENAEATKTITSEFSGDIEATTPGSGGFIETPQEKVPKTDRDRIDKLGEAAPEIERAPATGASIFTGTQRDHYLRAKAACAATSRRQLARDLGVTTTSPFAIAGAYAGKQPLKFWQAALEGCVVGVTKRGKR